MEVSDFYLLMVAMSMMMGMMYRAWMWATVAPRNKR